MQLILSTDDFDATTTFEVRFEKALVTSEEVGLETKHSPLVIVPEIPGRFSWLSQRSGMFTPSAPPALGQSYHFTLRPGLTALDGQPLRATLQRNFSTPPLTVLQCQGGWFDPSNAPSLPRFTVVFNADVSAAKAAPLAKFRSEDGKVIPAQATHATAENVGTHTRNLAWHHAFFAARNLAEEAPETEGRATTVSNCLIITPASPLPAGRGWRLVLGKSLPAAGERARLIAPVEQLIGEVLPFKIVDVYPQNILHVGKSLRIVFSRPLHPSVTSSNLGRWLSLSSSTLYESEISERSITLRGEFGKVHYLSIQAGLPGLDGFPLEHGIDQNIRFTPVPPGLFLPGFDAAQLSEGSRRLDLLAVNVRDFQVRAKWLDRHSLIHALRGYRHYFGRPSLSWDRKLAAYHRSVPWMQMQEEIDYELVPGRTLFQTNLTMSTVEDAPERFELSWNTVLGGKTNAAVFLAADTGSKRKSGSIGVGSQSLIQLTDLGLSWKRWGTNALVWVFSHTTGRPLAATKVCLLTDEDEVVSESSTDSNGLAWVTFSPQARWLLGEKGDDLHAVHWTDSHDKISLWNFAIPLEWRTIPASSPKLFVFTDRLTYRPGEAVHLKGIVRTEANEQLGLPEARSVLCRFLDARGRSILETNLVLSPQGSVATDLVVPESGLGQFVAQLELGDAAVSHAFQVQEFRPSAFEVSATMPAAFADEPRLDIGLSGRYYMGKALGKATVSWTVDASLAPFSHEAWRGYLFCSHLEGGIAGSLGRLTGSVTLQGTEKLSSNGTLQLSPALASNASVPQPQSIAVHAEVTDLNQQTISRDAVFTRHSSDFYLGIKIPRKVWPAGNPLPVELVAVRSDGTLQTGVTAIALSVTKLDWVNTRYQGAGGQPRYRSRLETNLVSRAELTLASVSPTTNSTRLQAIATAVELPEAGQYLLEATTTDGQGRPVLTAVVVNAGSPDDVLEWDYKNGDTIELVCDRPRYQPGDTARVLVKSPIVGSALVTVERAGVLRSFVTELVGNAPTIEIPLQTNDAPNIFVSVLQVRGANGSQREFPSPEYRLGLCQLVVENPASKLEVILTAGRDDYRPGEDIEIDGLITVLGRPRPGAEVTLYAVDDGVLSLSAYRTPDPHDFFFKQRPLAVASGISLQHLLAEDPNDQVFENKGYVVGGGGKTGARVRKNFQACAFWKSDLITDAAGRFQARFPAPDSLTRYRVMAVAHSAGSEFGSGDMVVEVNKPLMIEPALPQFAHVGDRIIARAVIHNRTGERAPIQVRVEMDATAVLPSRTLEVAAGGSAVVEFPVAFVKAGMSRWTWHARYDQQLTERSVPVQPVAFRAGRVPRTKESMSDAVETLLAVDHVAPRLREVLHVTAGTAETNLLARANPQLLEGDGEVIVRVSNSRVVDLLEAVDQLLHYPYGCVEQTSSSLLPWLVLQDLQDGLPSRRSEKEVDQAVRSGVNRLLSMQTESGGLSYWPGQGEAMFWGSAYGGMTLALAARQGAEIPEASLLRLFDFLSGELRHMDAGRESDKSAYCLALYALALGGRAEQAYVERLYQKRGTLTFEDRCLLSLAAAESGRDTILELLKKPATNHVAAVAGFGSPTRQTAIELLAWSHFDPNAPMVEQLVDKLAGTRTNGHWMSTQGNAWSLVALAEYIHSRATHTKPAQAKLIWQGKQSVIDLSGDPRVSEHRLSFGSSMSQWPLQLLNPDRAPCYVQVELSCRPKLTHQPKQDHGFSIQRNYTLLDDEGKAVVSQQWRVGDPVLVTLRVHAPRPAYYVAIDDPLPAVLEAINPEFKDQQSRHAAQLPGGWYSSFRELRADRALFFRDYLEAGPHTIRYLARVRAAGETTAPSAKIEEMYHPDVFGLSGSAVVQSLPLN